ncbi:hypothetical protein MHO82_07945 [Vibrio sp. Of7-15]|uniref:hypothetical protein n=1 Tax=Vibrio sp. Of7-15 TaxID=2724879 RepID=UPI001EF18885|nr:hypothetical protein [Vibrio sp. Of7-15]MCG7496790.1 hypothetical protein [Vibrio sp. Of7-15]
MTRLLAATLISSLALGGCGGSGGGDAGVGKSKGTTPPIQKEVYPEGIYFTTLADGDNDISRSGGEGNYVGVAMVVSDTRKGENRLVGHTFEDSDDGKQYPGSYWVNTKVANNTHDIDMSYCYADAYCGSGTMVSTEMGAGWLQSMNATQKEQLERDILDEKELKLSDPQSVLKIKAVDINSSTLLFHRLSSAVLADVLPEKGSKVQWQAEESLSQPLKYNTYDFELDETGTKMVMTASILDSQKQPQCVVTGTSPHGYGPSIVEFKGTMTPAEMERCEQYVKGQDEFARDDFLNAFKTEHTIMVGAIKNADDEAEMTVLHSTEIKDLHGDSLTLPLSAYGLLTKVQ